MSPVWQYLQDVHSADIGKEELLLFVISPYWVGFLFSLYTVGVSVLPLKVVVSLYTGRVSKSSYARVGLQFSLYKEGVYLLPAYGSDCHPFYDCEITSFSHLDGAVGDSGRAEVLNKAEHTD